MRSVNQLVVIGERRVVRLTYCVELVGECGCVVLNDSGV